MDDRISLGEQPLIQFSVRPIIVKEKPRERGTTTLRGRLATARCNEWSGYCGRTDGTRVYTGDEDEAQTTMTVNDSDSTAWRV